MDTFETYVSDRFPLRNQWVGIKEITEHATGKIENNGILFGKDRYLFEPFTMDEEGASQNIAAVNDFARQSGSMNVALMLAPTSITVYSERVLLFAEASTERAAIDSLYRQLDGRVQKFPVTELLLKQREHPIYFRTDHHWTMLGAYEGYVRASDVFGYEALGRDAFVREVVSEDFYGSFYARANDWHVGPDVLEYLLPVSERDVVVSYDDGSVSDSLVLEGALDLRDQYRFFLGGNYGLVKIESDVDDGRRLLVVKDLNAQDVGIDDVLIMYNVANFVDDAAVHRLAYE